MNDIDHRKKLYWAPQFEHGFTGKMKTRSSKAILAAVGPDGTFGDILDYGYRKLCKQKNTGKKSMDAIIDWLGEYDLKFTDIPPATISPCPHCGQLWGKPSAHKGKPQ